MSLLDRKPRPIPTRDKDPNSLRDDRLFIVACDDTYAPQQYFSFFRLSRVKIHVVPTLDGTSAAEYVLDRLLSFDYGEGDERWMLLDTDHVTQGTHLPGFLRALQAAATQGVNVALSKPCFELWLLLHHELETAVSTLRNAKEVEEALRARLGEYNKSNLKAEHYPQSSVVAAIERAENLDLSVGGGSIPNASATRVYQLWKAIVSKALPSQLPPEFHKFIHK
jgi:hypothetical protein